MRSLRICLAVGSLFGALFACAKKQEPPPAPPPPAAVADALSADDEVRPVYSAFAGPVLPLAQKLCNTLHDLPVARRAACCSGRKGTAFTSECTTIVSEAIRSGGITLDEERVQACVQAQEKTLAGCGWVGHGREPPPLPPECANLFQGTAKAGALCRSALDCGDGLTCIGAGPTAAGRCAPPKVNGQGCLGSIDTLAIYTLDYDDPRHPECAGFCGHRHCEGKLAAGAKCFLARQCGDGLHCDGSTCVAGPVALAGEKCVENCAAGLRCVSGICSSLKLEGATCKADAECIGGCIPGKNVCGMRCDVR